MCIRDSLHLKVAGVTRPHIIAVVAARVPVDPCHDTGAHLHPRGRATRFSRLERHALGNTLADAIAHVVVVVCGGAAGDARVVLPRLTAEGIFRLRLDDLRAFVERKVDACGLDVLVVYRLVAVAHLDDTQRVGQALRAVALQVGVERHLGWEIAPR
eukprot:6832438-Prymnesium_polylepis.1